MAQYDEEELKMRASLFDMAVPVVGIINLFAISEWGILQTKYGFSETDYPALKLMIDNMRDMKTFRTLTENPLLKMAMISNPMEDEKKDDDQSEN